MVSGRYQAAVSRLDHERQFMFNHAILGLLLVASVALSEPCKAQRMLSNNPDVIVSRDMTKITVLRKRDVCTYPFFFAGDTSQTAYLVFRRANEG